MMHFVRFILAVLALEFLVSCGHVLAHHHGAGEDAADGIGAAILAVVACVGAFFLTRWWWLALPAGDRAGWGIAVLVVTLLNVGWVAGRATEGREP